MRVGFIGNIAGMAYLWAACLRRQGVEAELFVKPAGLEMWGPDPEDKQPTLPSWVHIVGHTGSYQERWPLSLQRGARFFLSTREGGKLLEELLACDIVHSFTGSLFYSSAAFWAFGVRHQRPYVACASGDDLREVAVYGRLDGSRMRWFFRAAARTLLLNLDMIALKDRLGLDNADFFPFLIDVERYRPGVVERRYVDQDHVLFFMPSMLDWGVRDRSRRCHSVKGNDRFLRAFAKYVKTVNPKSHAVILDRGPDREEAKRLVANLAIGRSVTFLPEMQRDLLRIHFRMADVIVDQFEIGAFGTTALEAMACGKPTLIAINHAWADRCYPERPPVLNARTEEDILQQMILATNREYRVQLGHRAREWILRYHDGRQLAGRLIALYEDILCSRRTAACT